MRGYNVTPRVAPVCGGIDIIIEGIDHLNLKRQEKSTLVAIEGSRKGKIEFQASEFLWDANRYHRSLLSGHKLLQMLSIVFYHLFWNSHEKTTTSMLNSFSSVNSEHGGLCYPRARTRGGMQLITNILWHCERLHWNHPYRQTSISNWSDSTVGSLSCEGMAQVENSNLNFIWFLKALRIKPIHTYFEPIFKSVHDVESLEDWDEIRGTGFSLCNEDFATLDERLCAAFHHLLLRTGIHIRMRLIGYI